MNSLKNKVIGTWLLSSFDIEKEGHVKEWGKNARGLLIYTKNGYVSVSINRDVEATENEDRDVVNSNLFYAGSYEIKKNTVYHQVLFASGPNRIGKEMIRFASLEENTLTLSTAKEVFGTAFLKWKKVETE